MEAILETFKDIPGYEGLYQVSDCGCVRSLNYKGNKRIKYLRNTKHQTDYEGIDLYRDGKRKRFYIHRLVWEAFNCPIPDGYEIDHINGIRDDNRLVNLRVVTSKENSNNPITRERYLEAISQRSQNQKWIEATRKALNKPILQIDKQTGEVISEWECAMDAYRDIGINFCNISKCCQGKRKSAGGYLWKFA